MTLPQTSCGKRDTGCWKPPTHSFPCGPRVGAEFLRLFSLHQGQHWDCGQFGADEPCWAVLGMAGLAPPLICIQQGWDTFLPRYSIPSCLQMLPSVPGQMALGESQQSLPPTAFCRCGGETPTLGGARTDW